MRKLRYIRNKIIKKYLGLIAVFLVLGAISNYSSLISEILLLVLILYILVRILIRMKKQIKGLLNWVNYKIINKIKYRLRQKKFYESGMYYMDNMNGIEFEEYLKRLFKKMGYQVRTTAVTGDYGADLILRKKSDKIVVQAKRYNSTIGVSAVQQIVGAKGYYKADKGMVITNNYFTSNAVNLANANQIELWDRNKLSAVILSTTKKKRGIADDRMPD